jgi:hypothetical protein
VDGGGEGWVDEASAPQPATSTASIANAATRGFMTER